MEINNSNKNIPEIDGFRGYSIVLVISSHFGLGSILPGGFGVTIFFFVSGFLICKLLLHEIESSGTINFRKFYMRRLFRLYPALIVYIVLTAFYVYSQIGAIEWDSIFAALLYYINYKEVLYPDGALTSNLLGILWSLSVEEHFYIAFPVILYLSYRHKSLFILISLTLCVLILVIRYSYYLVLPINKLHDYNYYLTHTRLDSILYGCILGFLLYRSNSSQIVVNFLSSKIILLASILVLISSFIFRDSLYREVFRYTFQGAALFSVFFNIISAKTGKIMTWLFTNSLIIYIGKLSYSLYMYHWIVNIVWSTTFAGFHGFFPTTVAIFSTLGLSILSFKLVEQPFVKIRRKLGSNV